MEGKGILKEKTFSGLFWSFADILTNQGIQFIVIMILARLLAPEHFGVIGIVTIFISIANTIVDSGFTQALIREKKVTQDDYSTVFYFNLIASLVIYLLLFVLSPKIATFFNEDELTSIIRVLTSSVIIHSFSIIQRTILVKKIDFKLQTKINFVAAIGSGFIATVLGIMGYGIWSLVVQTISLRLIQTILLWFGNSWKPSFIFSVSSFRRLFKFSSRLLISSLIDTVYGNVFSILIGKYYPAKQLGYYTNAKKLSNLFSIAITSSLQRVTYPVLSSIQDDTVSLINGFRKIITATAYFTFPIMIGLMAVSDSLVVVVFGPKWIESILYFKLLCLAAMLYPFHALNLNILQVKGRSDLFLRLEIIKKLLLTLLIGASLLFSLGIVGLICAGIVSSYLSFFINTYYSSKEISYSTKQQIKDLLPFILISVTMGAFVHLTGKLLPEIHILRLLIQVTIGCVFYVLVSWILKLKEFEMMLQLIFRFRKFNKQITIKSRGI